jgi:hypothetical protein
MDTSEFFRLSGAEVAGLGWDECLEGMVAAREYVCRAQALELRFLARMSALSERAEYLADEIAPELRISRGAVESRIALAEALLGRMPKLLAAMEAGQLDRDKARQAHEASHRSPTSWRARPMRSWRIASGRSLRVTGARPSRGWCMRSIRTGMRSVRGPAGRIVRSS